MTQVKVGSFIYRCEECKHSDGETTHDVSCCNCCGLEYEDGFIDDFFEERDDEE